MEPDELLDRIQEVRARNNVFWVSLVRLAFRVAPDEARALSAQITAADEEILALSKKLSAPREHRS